MKRVLMLVPDIAAATGGIAMVSQSLFRLLGAKSRAGEIALEVLSLRPPADLQETRKLESWIGKAWRDYAGSQPRFSAAAIKRALQWPHLVLSMHVGLSQLQTFVPKLRGQKWLTFLYGLEVWERLSPLKRLALTAQPSVAISAFTIERMRETNPWFTGTDICHLGVFTPAPPAEKTRRPRVLIVGRMAKGEGMKGHRELFAAMKDVARACPEARLTVVGMGDDLERHKQWARETGVGDRIEFTGYLAEEELKSLYETSAVFCLPGWQEGFGLVYVEAMRAGLPCVATTADAAKEIIIHGETGLLVPPRDPAVLAQALIKLLTDPELAARFGNAGKSRYEALFTEAHFHERVWRNLAALL